MWVIKIGGSLQHNPNLRHWLRIIAEEGRGRLVLVPGGGDFADQVRRAQHFWEFDDSTAHRMALLGMHQYGWMLAGLQPALLPAQGANRIRVRLAAGEALIWLPDLKELDGAGIPHRWTITSDSLSAWLAGFLEAERLILVKSVAPGSCDVSQLQRDGIVDADFQLWLPERIQFQVYADFQWMELAHSLKSCDL